MPKKICLKETPTRCSTVNCVPSCQMRTFLVLNTSVLISEMFLKIKALFLKQKMEALMFSKTTGSYEYGKD